MSRMHRPFAREHTPHEMISVGQLHWTMLLRPRAAATRANGCGGVPLSHSREEQEDLLATSKLDRLAEELRALGIQF